MINLEKGKSMGEDRAAAEQEHAEAEILDRHLREQEDLEEEKRIAAAAHGVASDAFAGKVTADTAHALPRREPNPFIGVFDHSGAAPSEDLHERAQVALDKACYLEDHGLTIDLQIPGPASMFHLGTALHAAVCSPIYRQNPQAVAAAENMGRQIAQALHQVPRHEVSLRSLGQLLGAMWEGYDRLGPGRLNVAYEAARASTVEKPRDMPGNMPGSAFEVMRRAVEDVHEALTMLAEHPWQPEQLGPVGMCGKRRLPDHRDCPDCRVAHAGSPAAPVTDRRAAPPNPWFAAPGVADPQAEVDALAAAFERPPVVVDESTPVADSVLVDLATTQVIPQEAIEAVGGQLTDLTAEAYARLVAEKGVDFECARCGRMVQAWRGEEVQALELHQGSSECQS